MAPYDRDSIRDLRESLGMSQREFADHLGLPQATVNRWETGRTTPSGEYLGMMYDLARRHSRSFEPFADSTPKKERVSIAVEAAREWLRKSRGPRGKDRSAWYELFHQMLTLAAGADRRLQVLLHQAERRADAPEGELADLLREVVDVLDSHDAARVMGRR